MWGDGWPEIRREVLERDGFACQACPRAAADPVDPPEWLHAHHVRARKDGGPDEAANCVTLCDECHREKHAGRTTYLSAEFVRTVRGYGPLTSGEVAEWMGCSPSTARRRLSDLETKGEVVSADRDGVTRWRPPRSFVGRILAALWPFRT